MRMNIGIGSFCLEENATRNFFWILVFWFDGGGGVYEKGRFTFCSGPAFFVFKFPTYFSKYIY